MQGRRLVCFKRPRVTHSLGPSAASGSPSPFPNLPSSSDPFPSSLNTSWFVGTADGINNAEVVVMVGDYDGGFRARVGCTGLAILIYCRPWAQMGQAKWARPKGPGWGQRARPKVYRPGQKFTGCSSYTVGKGRIQNRHGHVFSMEDVTLTAPCKLRPTHVIE